MNSNVESMRWVMALLIAIAAWMAWVVYVASPLPNSRFLGGFLLAIGVFNAAFHKGSGRRAFAQMKSRHPLVAWFWVRSGERGSQFLFLGIAIILAVAGLFIIIRSA